MPNDNTGQGSKVGTDMRYHFDKTRLNRNLESDQEKTGNANLRYTFGKISFFEKVIFFDIESYCSDLYSNLNTEVPAGQRVTLNSLTHYYAVSGSDAYIDVPDSLSTDGGHLKLPSYNPILTALRCFGLLEALKDICATRAAQLGKTTQQIDDMKDMFDAKFTNAKVLQNLTYGIGADVTYTHYTNFKN